MNGGRIIDSCDALAKLLEDLGYRSMLQRNGTIRRIDCPIFDILEPFLINFAEPGLTPGKDMFSAMHKIISFFPLTPVLANEINVLFEQLINNALLKTTPTVRAETHPVAYFIIKAQHLTGFPFFAIACRDLIKDYGYRAIPATLVLCSALRDAASQNNILPKDIIDAPDRYTKLKKLKSQVDIHGQAPGTLTEYKLRSGTHSPTGMPLEPIVRLAKPTIANYKKILRKLLPYLADIFFLLGFGHVELLLYAEDQEIVREDRHRKKYYSKLRVIPDFSSPHVLKPHILGHFLILSNNLSIDDHLAFNDISIRLVLSIIFHYGSRGVDLLDLKINNYDQARHRIIFAIYPDPLLQETHAYILLHCPVADWIEEMLAFRARTSDFKPHDPLFTLIEKNGEHRPMSMFDLNSFIAKYELITGMKINAKFFYWSHQCYYNHIGNLNPIIDDRLSNRKDENVYIPRLYTRTSIAQLRESHFVAFEKVIKFLNNNIVVEIREHREETSEEVGGKRAIGGAALKKIFSSLHSRVKDDERID